MLQNRLSIQTVVAGLAATIALSVSAAPLSGYMKIEGIDGESLKASTDEIERQFRELSHVVQQGGSRSTGLEAASIADRIIAETRKLEELYSAPEFREGKRYARSLAADARKIKQQARRLGGAPSAQDQARFQQRVSETLRHKDRTLAAHQRWVTSLASRSSERPTERQ